MALDLKSYIIGKQNGGGGDVSLKTLNVTENGTQNAPSGEAYNKVIVNVQPPLEEKTVTENGAVTPSANKYGLSKVTVNVPLPSGTVSISANGTANVKDYEYAEIDVQPNLEVKPVVVSANGTRDIVPDTGYDGISKVELEVDVQPDLEAGTGSITTNGTHTFSPTEGKDGFSDFTATVNVPSYPEPTGSLDITENGEDIDVKDVASVNVDVKDWLDLEFSDGKTRIWLDLIDDELLSLDLIFSLYGTMKINWGDGSQEETFTRSDSITTSSRYPHTYSQKGKYIISIEVTSGSVIGAHMTSGNNLTFIVSSTDAPTMQSAVEGNTETRYFHSRVIRLDISYSSLIDSNRTFADPSGAFFFARLSNLKRITLPENVLSIRAGTFREDYTLEEIVLPENGEYTIFGSVFEDCKAVRKIKIPVSVIKLEQRSFSGMITCRLFDFTAFNLDDGALPITFGTNVFLSINTDAVILFATKEIADVAKETTNLSTYASYIHYVGEEEETV